MQRGLPLMDRLVSKVVVETPEDCWGWSDRLNSVGYGKIKVQGRWLLAHRAVYELFVGPIPEGMQLDHLCRNRGCVNPDHLEPVTNRENWRRGEHPAAIVARTGRCARGHSMEDAAINKDNGWRTCRTCLNERAKRRRSTPLTLDVLD